MGSIGTQNSTTNPSRPQGPGSANANTNQSLFKPVNVSAQHHQNSLNESASFHGSNLINLDTFSDPLGVPTQRGRHAFITPPSQQLFGGQGENWGSNMRPGAVPTGLDEMTELMSNMNMAGMQLQQNLNSKLPANMATMNMMNPSMSSQMMHMPRASPSKLSMMTNQQLMMLAQTVHTDTHIKKHAGTKKCSFSKNILFQLARAHTHTHSCKISLCRTLTFLIFNFPFCALLCSLGHPPHNSPAPSLQLRHAGHAAEQGLQDSAVQILGN